MHESNTPPGRPRAPSRASRPQVADGRHWWVKYGIAFVFAVLVVNAVAGERGYLELKRLEQRHADAVARLAALRADNASLQGAIRRMRTDPAAIEEAVRRQLGYSKPGELVFTVKPARPPAAPATGPNDVPSAASPAPADPRR